MTAKSRPVSPPVRGAEDSGSWDIGSPLERRVLKIVGQLRQQVAATVLLRRNSAVGTSLYVSATAALRSRFVITEELCFCEVVFCFLLVPLVLIGHAAIEIRQRKIGVDANGGGVVFDRQVDSVLQFAGIPAVIVGAGIEGQ